MNLLLHIGLPKAGSSSLQAWLSENRQRLASAGYAYPRSALFGDWHHSVIGVVSPNRTPPRLILRRFGSAAAFGEAAECDWKHILRQAEGAHTIVLSSEGLSVDRPERPSFFERFDKIMIAAFVREPGAHYGSRVQQWVKAAPDLPAIDQFDSTSVLSAYCSVGSVRVMKAEDDVCCGFRSLLTLDLPPMRRRENKSLSAEAVTVLNEHFRSFPRARVLAECTSTVRIVRSIDGELPGFSKPRMHSDLRHRINSSDRHLPYLRDRFGIVYSGYEEADGSGGEPPSVPGSVPEVFEVDDRRLDAFRRTFQTRMKYERGWLRRAKGKIKRLIPAFG